MAIRDGLTKIQGSYQKKVQNTKRNRVFSSKLGFFALNLNMSEIQLLMVLAAVLMLCIGCGNDNELTVDIDVSNDEPNPVTPTDSPKEAVEGNEAVSVTVRGLVLDQVAKTPLVDVRVQLTDEAGVVVETLTTTSGVFEFKDVAADQRLTIAIDSDEYKEQEFAVDPISGGETVKLEVELIPLNPEQLPEGDGLTVGLKAPDFNLPDSDGEMIALADYAGEKKVVLVFDRGGW